MKKNETFKIIINILILCAAIASLFIEKTIPVNIGIFIFLVITWIFWLVEGAFK